LAIALKRNILESAGAACPAVKAAELVNRDGSAAGGAGESVVYAQGAFRNGGLGLKACGQQQEKRSGKKPFHVRKTTIYF
jgi:hypothetical protein